MILSTLITSTELSIGHQQIYVVATDVVLSQVDDSHHQTLLSMVVGGFLRDIAHKLRYLDNSSARETQMKVSVSETHFDLGLQFAFEATPNNLPLTGLETIGNGRYRPHIIGIGEENELPVDEVGYGNLPCVVIEIRAGLGHKSVIGQNCSGHKLTSSFRSHSLRSSAFFLLNARSIRSRSSAFTVPKGIICLFI